MTASNDEVLMAVGRLEGQMQQLTTHCAECHTRAAERHAAHETEIDQLWKVSADTGARVTALEAVNEMVVKKGASAGAWASMVIAIILGGVALAVKLWGG